MKAKILIAIIVSFFCNFHSALAQGVLTPSAPPGPTMVTLSQMEPRTPISSVPYTISQAGSYYLTTNLLANGNAITINANDVTLDLSGFTISSATNLVAGTAILLNGAVTNIAIFNGHIISGVTNSSGGSYAGSGFNNGIFDGGAPANVRVKNVSVAGVLDYGIFLGTASTLVEACAVNVAGLEGIQATTVSGSTVLNAGSYAIAAQTAENCYATSIINGGASISCILVENCYGSTSGNGDGIYAQTAENCYGYSGSGGAGIFADTAENCYGEGVDGIDVANCAENCYGTAATGYGIDAQVAVNCEGVSDGSGTGMTASYTAQNCYGGSNTGTGLLVGSMAQNCFGSSNTGVGLSAGNATSCAGNCSGSNYGLDVTYLALGCYGYSATGTGLVAFLANSCVGNTLSGTATNLTHNINSFGY